jgi:hypothetical protein
MNKYKIDYKELEKNLDKQSCFKYEDVKHKIEKVAFDIVRFRPDHDNSIDGLWQIQNTEDGEVILAMYSDEAKPDKEENKVKNVRSEWKAIKDKSASSINIFFKNEPIIRIASASLGIHNEEIDSVCSHLEQNLSTNSKLRNSLLNTVTDKERASLLEKYPELRT